MSNDLLQSAWSRPEPEELARRAIEDAGFTVHSANILFRANCPNIDLVVYAKTGATYVQVKSSKTPAGKDRIIIDASPWSRGQLDGIEPLYNKKGGLMAAYVVLVDLAPAGSPEFYVVTPKQLTDLVLPMARKWARRPKRDGSPRSVKFRKELPRALLKPWRNAWAAFGEPTKPAVSNALIPVD